MNKLRSADADMKGVSAGWGLGVCVGGGGGKVKDSSETRNGIVTGTTELPAAPVR